jgi:hypothetical protein
VLSLHALFELITETDVLAARDVPRIVLRRATTNTWFASHCGGRHTPRKRVDESDNFDPVRLRVGDGIDACAAPRSFYSTAISEPTFGGGWLRIDKE